MFRLWLIVEMLLNKLLLIGGGELGDFTTYARAITNLPSGVEELIFTSSGYSTTSFYGRLNKLPFPNTILRAVYMSNMSYISFVDARVSKNLDEEVNIGLGMLGMDITLIAVYAYDANVIESDILSGTSYMVPVIINILNQ